MRKPVQDFPIRQGLLKTIRRKFEQRVHQGTNTTARVFSLSEISAADEPVPYSAANICSAAGPYDPFSEEQLGGCTGPGICALSVGRAGGRSSEQHFQCHPCPAGTGSRTADRTEVQWLFQAQSDISRCSPDCAEMRNRDGQK